MDTLVQYFRAKSFYLALKYKNNKNGLLQFYDAVADWIARYVV